MILIRSSLKYSSNVRKIASPAHFPNQPNNQGPAITEVLLYCASACVRRRTSVCHAHNENAGWMTLYQ